VSSVAENFIEVHFNIGSYNINSGGGFPSILRIVQCHLEMEATLEEAR